MAATASSMMGTSSRLPSSGSTSSQTALMGASSGPAAGAGPSSITSTSSTVITNLASSVGSSTGNHSSIQSPCQSVSSPPLSPPGQPSSMNSSADPLGYMIPAESIQIQKDLGIGEFGVVQQAVWTRSATGGQGSKIQVAIKRLSRDRMQADTTEFLKEATIMHNIRSEHIVRLYGVVQTADSLMLVTELAPLRSLLECLRDPLLGQSAFPTNTLCDFAHQICDGMLYLETNRLIHRDLAARNILVFTQRKVKISDFGLSRALGVGKDYYQTNYNANLKLPIAWCAPECINFLRFTSSSDVWAYGVTLWEMFSYGAQPWANLTGAEILDAIDEPHFKRLDQPERCPDEFYGLMNRFWAHDPAARPTFARIKKLLPEIAHTPRHPKSSTESRTSQASEFDFSNVCDDVFLQHQHHPASQSSTPAHAHQQHHHGQHPIGGASGGPPHLHSNHHSHHQQTSSSAIQSKCSSPSARADQGKQSSKTGPHHQHPSAGDQSSILNDCSLNMKNEIKEIANRITLHSLKHKHKHSTVKPISAADSLQLDSAIDLAKELASWSMLDQADQLQTGGSLDSHHLDHAEGKPLINQSPKTPNSPNKKSHIFNFNFQLKSLTGGHKSSHSNQTAAAAGHHNEGHNPEAGNPIDAILTQEAKEAYASLVEKGDWAGCGRRRRSYSNPSSSSPPPPNTPTLDPTGGGGPASTAFDFNSTTAEFERSNSGGKRGGPRARRHNQPAAPISSGGGHMTLKSRASPQVNTVGQTWQQTTTLGRPRFVTSTAVAPQQQQRRHNSGGGIPAGFAPPIPTTGAPIQQQTYHHSYSNSHPLQLHPLQNYPQHHQRVPSNPLPLPPRDRTKPLPKLKQHIRKYPLIMDPTSGTNAAAIPQH